MIRIHVTRHQDGYITECSVEGHAGYDEHGFDIVCAAVSAIVCTAVLGLQNVAGMPGLYENQSGYCIVRPNNPKDASVRAILDTMMLGLTEISHQYGSFVKVKVNGR